MLHTLVTVAALVIGAERPSLEGLSLVKREQWDPTWPAALSNGCHRYERPIRSVLKWIVVHHTDFIEPPGPIGILDYHLQVSRYCDIAYHYVIDKDGVIYEARPLELMGAHAGITREGTNGKTEQQRALDPDFGSIGIVLDGYFHDRPPSEHQLRALEMLVHLLRMRFAIPNDRLIAHREVRPRLVEARGLTFVGDGTTCPGDALMAALSRMRGW